MREPDFEQSADMRLLELQRGALGLPARERTAWESHTSGEAGVPIEPPDERPGSGALLAVEAAATPAEGVIPGAVVTFTLSIANEGASEAADIVAAAPLPGAAAYRPGSFVWNGRSTYDDVADAFFTRGLPIGALGPGDRATFTWKVGVRLGIKPLVVAPSVRAPGSAIVGARPVVVSRKPSTAAFVDRVAEADLALYEPMPLMNVEIPATELPMYELDEEESLVYEAADAALSSAAPPVAPPAVQDEPAAAIPAAPPPAPPPEPVPEPVREAIVLYGRFDRATVAFFERALAGARPPTLLQHCILGGALACSLDAGGDDPAAIKRHLAAQSQVLHRIVLHEKLGKKEPIAEYAGELLAQLEELRPRPVVAPPAASKDGLTLVTELSAPTIAVLAKIAEERARWDFVKARQLTLALQAQSLAVAGVDDAVRERIEAALRAYAQASVTVLQRLFVRIRIDRTTGLLFQNDGALDDAGSAAVAALKAALP